MNESAHDSTEVQAWLDRLRAGDATARAELLDHACRRLRLLTRKMLQGFPRVHRWEETDDVLQNALVRLWNALQEVAPPSARAFYGLAALQIRRALLDLARQYSGPQGLGAHQATPGAAEDSTPLPPAVANAPDTTLEPAQLAIWTEFHARVDTLPDEEREVFDLLWYQELPQHDAAALLGISEATLKRRWLSARRRLHQILKGQLPGL